MDEKRCTKCEVTKPVVEFVKSRASKDGLSYWCKECHRIDARRYQLANKDKVKETQRKYRERNPEKVAKWKAARDQRANNLRTRFDMTVEQYEELLAAQGGACAICGKAVADAGKRRLHVDHDYETWNVRGILCGNCNRGVGMFMDSPDLLEKAAKYLRHAAANPTGIRARKDLAPRNSKRRKGD